MASLGIVSTLLLSGCSDSEPAVNVEVQTLTDRSFMGGVTVPVVWFSAIADEVTVEDVIVNRGNCKMTAYAKSRFPHTLLYGQKADAGFTAGCSVSEVEIVTNEGSWTFNF